MNKKKKTLDSLEALRTEYGLPPLRRQTRDKVKLEGQRQAFKSRHKCPICEAELQHIEGTNLMFCPNKDCKGIKKSSVDEETGETIDTFSSISFELLDDRGTKIVHGIFY